MGSWQARQSTRKSDECLCHFIFTENKASSCSACRRFMFFNDLFQTNIYASQECPEASGRSCGPSPPHPGPILDHNRLKIIIANPIRFPRSYPLGNDANANQLDKKEANKSQRILFARRGASFYIIIGLPRAFPKGRCTRFATFYSKGTVCIHFEK